jgi:hypothetical protein
MIHAAGKLIGNVKDILCISKGKLCAVFISRTKALDILNRQKLAIKLEGMLGPKRMIW